MSVYELRHTDTHLPSSKVEEAFEHIEIDRSAPFGFKCYTMLFLACLVLSNVSNNGDKRKKLKF